MHNFYDPSRPPPTTRQKLDNVVMDLLELYKLPPAQIKNSDKYQRLVKDPDSIDRVSLLYAITTTSNPSYRPLYLLLLLLKDVPGSWPLLPLIQCYHRLAHNAPDNAQTGDAKGGMAWLHRELEQLVIESCGSLEWLLWQDDRRAIMSTQENEAFTHRELRTQTQKFALPIIGEKEDRPVVAIALPNGPLLAAVALAVATYYTAALIDPATVGPDEFQADLVQTGATAVITTPEEFCRLRIDRYTASGANIDAFLVRWEKGKFKLFDTRGQKIPPDTVQPVPNHGDHVAFKFFTISGYGAKDVVSLTTHAVIRQAALSMEAWELTSSDVCLNMTSLHTVGGFVRNVLVPVWSGGSTICCPAFDATMFWEVAAQLRPTWYSASSSMNCVILSKAASNLEARRRARIRLVCITAAANTSGQLGSTLECDLRDTFQCKVILLGEEQQPQRSQQAGAVARFTTAIGRPADVRTLTGGQYEVPGCPSLGSGTLRGSFDGYPATAPPGCERGKPLPLKYEDPGGLSGRTSCDSDTHSIARTVAPDYLGDDGYMYVMGRSQEAITRAGTAISPFEVEAAVISAAVSSDSAIYGRVLQALAFSVRHETLGEAVAVVLVTPPGSCRVDLKTLYRAIRPTLSPPKWPLLIVYMGDLPRNHGVPAREGLAERLGLPILSDKTPYLSKHWQAFGTPSGPATAEISCSACRIDRATVTNAMRGIVPSGYSVCLRLSPVDGCLEAFVAPKDYVMQPLAEEWVANIQQLMGSAVHNYMIPNKIHLLPEPFPEDPLGQVDEEALQTLLSKHRRTPTSKRILSTEARVTKLFAKALGCKTSKVHPSVDFFSLGGDDVGATKLHTALQTEFNVRLPGELVSSQGTVNAISMYIDAAIAQPNKHDRLHDHEQDDSSIRADCRETRSSTNKLLLMFQLLPLVVFYPVRRATQWAIFLTFLGKTRHWAYIQDHLLLRLSCLLLAIVVAYAAIQLISPFLGIAAKWIIIGRYREGKYPMWGSYHTRWWIVQKIVLLTGAGFFNEHDSLKAMYCRLMGAKIGRNVQLTGALIGEWDLLDIRDGAILDSCSCRPFGVERNTTMLLQKIVIGENASIGIGSVVAPGSVIPPNTCVGINSTSWELGDASEVNRELSDRRSPEPHLLLTIFGTGPIFTVGWIIALIPWFIGLFGLVREKPEIGMIPFRNIMEWFSMSPTVGFHYLPLILRSVISPYLLFGYVVLVRMALDWLLGDVQTKPAKAHGNLDLWRISVTRYLLPEGRVQAFTEMFGQHGEATSLAFRLLGAKVGDRVYWPCEIPKVTDYRMLDIGNDVVIGNRCQFITHDGVGTGRIWIRDGSVLEEGVCVLPGVDIGARTAFGSESVTRRDKTYAAEGVYIGSRGGDAVCVTTGRCDVSRKLSLPSRIHHTASTDTLVPGHGLRHVDSSDTLVPGSLAGDSFSFHEKYPVRQDKYTVRRGGPPRTPRKLQRHPSIAPPAPATVSHLRPKKPLPYHVLSSFTIWFYCNFMAVLCPFFWNIPIICAIKITGRIFHDHLGKMDGQYDFPVFWSLTSLFACILTPLFALLAMSFVVIAKWSLLGKTSTGRHDWDKSSYGQRRQLFLTIERLVYRAYRGKGVLGMITGTHWLVLYYRALGAKIGKDCALFANGRLSVAFTEPDMIVMGDRVALDDASLVAHREVRNLFDLDRISIGDRSVIRAGSTVLAGAQLRPESRLLEHTLVMAGDVVEAKQTMQGSPAQKFFGRGDRKVFGSYSPGEASWASGFSHIDKTGGLVVSTSHETTASRSNSDATLVGDEDLQGVPVSQSGFL